jgi:hypothetical protein
LSHSATIPRYVSLLVETLRVQAGHPVSAERYVVKSGKYAWYYYSRWHAKLALPDPIQNPPLEESENAPGTVHENLEGWVPPLATEDEIRSAFEKAFDYRGDLTLTLKNGEKIEGYIFDRRNEAATLSGCYVRLMPKNRPGKIKILYSDIAALAFTGKDTAAGKSFAAWVKKYSEKKAAGERNIGIESDSLDEE